MTFAVGPTDPVPDATVKVVGAWPMRATRGGTVRQRLRAFVVVGVVLVVAVAATGLISVSYVRDRGDEITELTTVRNDLNQFGEAIRGTRSDVDQSIFAGQGVVQLTQVEALQASQALITVISSTLGDAQAQRVPVSVHSQINGLTPELSTFLTEAGRLLNLAYTNLSAATAALPAFHKMGDEVITGLHATLASVELLVVEARDRSSHTLRTTATVLVGMLVLTIFLLGLCASVIGRSLRRTLRTLSDVARSIARGDLGARAVVTSSDELGTLGHAINDMAGDLQVLVEQMETTAQRDGFGSQLSEALEMADTEAEALSVIERAMASISTTIPMEILLADSSKAHLACAASNPISGAPGCPVESPFSCVAVRRGNPVVFDDSEALNACPKLRGRPAGPISAVCVPVTFMGRALGVLHSTGPIGATPAAESASRLTSLATQAGARIGTVRSFERSQLQATTDGLTGLRNRRTVEIEVRALLNEGAQLMLVMADLDHFKLLNDTYGHEAGDRALRMFSQVLETSLRQSDIAARFGGEEFVIAMPEASAATAVAVLDRLRERLAVVANESGSPTFTASYGIVDSTLGGSLEDLLRVADAALYRAKEEGRNRVTVADERDVTAAARPATTATNHHVKTVGAFQRAASLDDPMPLLPNHH